jgi:hypothetical protein
MDDEIVMVQSAAGMIEAEILRGLLESNAVQAWLSHEAAGTAYGITVGPVGKVDIMVLKKDLDLARSVLDDYYAGRLEQDDKHEGGVAT